MTRDLHLNDLADMTSDFYYFCFYFDTEGESALMIRHGR